MRSSKPLAAIRSARQPEALCPFQVGLVVVTRSAAAAAHLGTASLAMRRRPRPPRDRIHRTEKASPDSMSARVIARLTAIGTFT